MAKKVTFHLRRDPYVPAGVLKAFVKMGLTLLPAEEMGNFGEALAWINQTDHQKGPLFEFPIPLTFQPGPMRSDLIVALLYRRKGTIQKVPYAFFCLAYGNELFQVMLPTPERDGAKGSAILPLFPMPQYYGPQTHWELDLTGQNLVKEEIATFEIVFEEIKSGPIT